MPNRIHITVADDHTAATLEITPEHAGTVLSFTPDQLLGLIQGLGQAHQTMVKGRELPPLIGKRVDVVTDTRWAIGTEQLGEATVISFQHPAYGPVSFMIPLDQAEKIGRRMLAQVETAKASRARAN